MLFELPIICLANKSWSLKQRRRDYLCIVNYKHIKSTLLKISRKTAVTLFQNGHRGNHQKYNSIRPHNFLTDVELKSLIIDK